MAKPKPDCTDVFAALHAAAEGLYRVGAMDKATLRGFDPAHLMAPAPMAPSEIRAIRERAKVSQPVFARYLNTSESTVQKWEAGTKRPSGTALKLLGLVARHGLEILA